MKVLEKLKKIRITKRFFIEAFQTIAILALFALLGVWYAFGSRAGSSERYVMKYFEYFLMGNYEKMYDMVDVTESLFVNEDSFEAMMDTQAIMGGINEYDVELVSKKDGVLEYEIKYTKKDETKGVFNVVLEKQPQKTYLLFNTWKVNVDSSIIDSYTVGIPSDMVGTIDGMPIDSFYDNTSLDGEMKYYVFLRLFEGEHTFTISGENIDTYNETVYLESDDKEKDFVLEDFSMPPNEKEEITEYSKYIINQMYEHALQGSDFTEIEELFANSEQRRSAIRYLYDDMVEWSVGDNGAKLETFEINKMSAKIHEYNYPDEAAVKVTYNYSYTALDERTMLTANQAVLSGKGKANAYVYYKRNERGKWRAIRVVMKLPNYSEPAEQEES